MITRRSGPGRGRPATTNSDSSVPRRVRIGGDLWHPVTPDGAVRITRPGRWGNPHKIGEPCRVKACGAATHTRDAALALFAGWLRESPALVARARTELAGRDLACWCKSDDRCHGDIWLSVLSTVDGAA